MGNQREPVLHYRENRLHDYLPPAAAEEGRLIFPDMPPDLLPLEDIDGAIENMMEESLDPGIPPLGHMLGNLPSDARISIILDDHTRPNVHTMLVLPRLLASISGRGFPSENIYLVIATGTHRPSTTDELIRIMGQEVFSGFRERIVMHDCRADLKSAGRVSDGTAVLVNRTALNSNLILALTDMEFHYFTGIAGGPKSLIPGIGGEEIVNAEHVKMFGSCGFAPGVESGSIEDNPVFRYKLECIRLIDAMVRSRGDWIYSVNAVVDRRGRLVFLNGGDILGGFYRAIPALRRTWTAVLERPADVVIVNSRHEGINLLQAGKAFNAAARGVRPGGRILVLAPCPDGFGNKEFKNLMRVSSGVFGGGDEAGLNTIEEAIVKTQRRILEGFKMGYQKPVDLLMTLRHTGWRRLFLLQEGLRRDEADEILPFMRVLDASRASPSVIIAGLAASWEAERPSYLVLDEPGLVLRLREPEESREMPGICPT